MTRQRLPHPQLVAADGREIHNTCPHVAGQHRSLDSVIALIEDQVSGCPDDQPAAPLHPVVVVLAGLAVAAAIVALTTLIALGLDALLRLDLQFVGEELESHE